jgi:hypothetical protein
MGKGLLQKTARYHNQYIIDEIESVFKAFFSRNPITGKERGLDRGLHYDSVTRKFVGEVKAQCSKGKSAKLIFCYLLS